MKHSRRSIYSWRAIDQYCETNSFPKNLAQALFDRYFELIRIGVEPRKSLWIMNIIEDERS